MQRLRLVASPFLFLRAGKIIISEPLWPREGGAFFFQMMTLKKSVLSGGQLYYPVDRKRSRCHNCCRLNINIISL